MCTKQLGVKDRVGLKGSLKNNNSYVALVKWGEIQAGFLVKPYADKNYPSRFDDTINEVYVFFPVFSPNIMILSENVKI